ncbi:DMT family transporter [Cucumibacter marinus]|uniref:DMT family transporter n=1 Tax=Cucumibacter marinus TaxID=1121252 RepID=UPI0004108080|nr:DMT family transporter [Cucumibacter marinus]
MSHTPSDSLKISSGTYLILMLAPLFWSGNAVAGKLAVGEIDPLMLASARFVGAVLVTFALAWPHLRKDWPEIRRTLIMLLLFGAIGFATFNALLYTAPLFTTALNVSIEQASIPVMVMLGNFLVFRVRARLLQIAGVFITILGVLFVASHGDLGRLLTLSVNQGDALVLAACVVYTLYSLALRFRPSIHWMSFLAVCSFGAMIAALAYQLGFGGGTAGMADSLSRVTPKGWMIVVYTAIFPSILSQLCYAWSVERIGANRASLFINLIPVMGTILSVIVIGEVLQSYHYLAFVLVVIGIVLAEYAASRKTGARRPAAAPAENE